MALNDALHQKLKNLKAYVFDLDGTLINSVEAHVNTWIASFKYVGYEVKNKDVKKLIGLSGRDIVYK
ncbi:MAG: HAD family hydrolase, partial [Desulfurococcales archaeon]|nr:HAD family hydrolase [Desulfurococcales archaeon]